MSYARVFPRPVSFAATGPFAPRMGAMSGFGGYGAFGAFDATTGQYTVEQGDYVAKIASKMGCSGGAHELINANPGKNLGSGKIYAGQKIAIPSTCANFQPPPQVQQTDPSQPNPGIPGITAPPPGITAPPIVDPGVVNPGTGSGSGSYTPAPQPNPIPTKDEGLFGLGSTGMIVVGAVGAAFLLGIGIWAFGGKSEPASRRSLPPTKPDREEDWVMSSTDFGWPSSDRYSEEPSTYLDYPPPSSGSISTRRMPDRPTLVSRYAPNTRRFGFKRNRRSWRH